MPKSPAVIDERIAGRDDTVDIGIKWPPRPYTLVASRTSSRRWCSSLGAACKSADETVSSARASLFQYMFRVVTPRVSMSRLA